MVEKLPPFRFQFPECTLAEEGEDALFHLMDEVEEVRSGYFEYQCVPCRDTKRALMMELFDVIHKAESIIREYNYSEDNLTLLRNEVIRKNDTRGYYN